MAFFAPKNDFEYIRSQNPYADIQLYTPGTKLTANDFALGGSGAEAGILDDSLGGAKRLSGLDRNATAQEYYKHLSTVKPQTTPQVKYDSNDPMASIIGNDPEAAAYYKQAQQAAKLGSRNAMETLNTRGILNSTITGDAVTGLEQQAMTNVLPQLYAFAEQKKQQAKQDAFTRMNTLGYADNEVSKILGIPVGTPSASYSMQEAGLTGNYKGQKTLDAQNIANQNSQWERSFGANQEQFEWEKAFKEKGFTAEQANEAARIAISRQNANSGGGVTTPKAPTTAEINAQRDGIISQVTSAIYNKVYTENNSTASALSTLSQNKGAILSDLTLAGMSAKEALEYYQQMYDDLSGV